MKGTHRRAEIARDGESTENEQLDDERLGADRDQLMNRRRFLAAAGAAGVALAAGPGTASASDHALNYSSGLVPDPWIESDVTVAEHDRSEMTSETEFINDAGEFDDLAEQGARLQPRPDTTTTTAWNPVTLRADKFAAEEYYKFPRGETYDKDGDGDANTDLDVLDVTHWTTDTSGTAGTLTFEDVNSPAGTKAIHATTSSQVSGDVAVARFSDFSIADGELRKHFQLGVTVDALPAGSTVTFRVEDSTGATVDMVIDPSADGSLASTIATSTVTGLVYQPQLGDLTSSLDTIEAIEIRIADENPDLTVWALNCERSSRWDYGTREFVNADDEIETETVYEPSGTFSITSADTLGTMFDNATVHDLQAALRFDTSGVDDRSMVEYEFVDLDHPSYPRQFNMVVNRELETAYDLDYANTSLRDETVHWPEQYQVLDVSTGETETATLEDVDDLTMSDKTSLIDSRDQEIELATTVTDGEVEVLYYEVRVDESAESDMVVQGASGPASQGGGGFWSSTRGMLTGIVAGIAVFIGMVKTRILG